LRLQVIFSQVLDELPLDRVFREVGRERVPFGQRLWHPALVVEILAFFERRVYLLFALGQLPLDLVCRVRRDALGTPAQIVDHRLERRVTLNDAGKLVPLSCRARVIAAVVAFLALLVDGHHPLFFA
jgi:hypothetical protein